MTDKIKCRCGSMEFDYLGRQFAEIPTFLGQEVPVLDLVNCTKCGNTKNVGEEYIERAGINEVDAFKEYQRLKK